MEQGVSFTKVILKIRFLLGYLNSNIEKKLGVFASLREILNPK
jgi:hypothetical protein